jgi:glycosyltransferase involved in cell wall biosynthesis
MPTGRIGITWKAGRRTGWSLVGLHLARRMLQTGQDPVLLAPPDLETIAPAERPALARLHCDPETAPGIPTVLHALGNPEGGTHGAWLLTGARNAGLIAFEETRLLPDDLARHDVLVAHSTWNQHLLAESGMRNTVLALQGVEPDRMRPWPRMGRFGDRFVVFSGGKLEFRKGQDIVLAAFRRFQARHSEALLVTAWHSPWPEIARTMAESALAPVAPRTDAAAQLDTAGWAVANGVPAECFRDLGFLPHDLLPRYFGDCDVAIFPNRCEGATNLVAMEAMACGVPVILSANTGHLDIIRDESCLALRDQRAVADPSDQRRGWGESSVDEADSLLEQVFNDRAAARARAMRASAFIRTERTWDRFADTLLAAIEEPGAAA